ncbi:hypothetical protein CVD28_16985 [Bacillus sp. M6-12]|uniref:tail fiber protein n=1 Tax=Bacillus sp. M6-12 TaxID=2054166 RepID=UPI000C75E034|nr:tail fiber protein [Bacillus sp. M6-12]PLS16768.1 hypothetical protein CVD28_16985 [Bacillus sp. M6-12]
MTIETPNLKIPKLTDTDYFNTANLGAIDKNAATQSELTAHKAETASTTIAGHVQLNDNIKSTLITQAATANAVKKAYDLVNGKSTVASSTTNGNIKVNNAETVVYSHPTGDGNMHVPATGTTNDGKVLMAGSTDGSISWQPLPNTGGMTLIASQTLASTHATVSFMSIPKPITQNKGLLSYGKITPAQYEEMTGEPYEA